MFTYNQFISLLKMEAADTSQTSSSWATSTRCEDSGTGSTFNDAVSSSDRVELNDRMINIE
jgi:hypothetical protein